MKEETGGSCCCGESWRRNEGWLIWSGRFQACSELAGRTSILNVVAAQAAPIKMTGAQPETINVGKLLYAVVLSNTEGKGFSIVHVPPCASCGNRGVAIASCRIRGYFWSEAGNDGAKSCLSTRTKVNECSAGERVPDFAH